MLISPINFPIVELVQLELTIFSVVDNTLPELDVKHKYLVLLILDIFFPQILYHSSGYKLQFHYLSQKHELLETSDKIVFDIFVR